MKQALNNQAPEAPKGWADVYSKFGISISTEDEAAITNRLTQFFDLLNKVSLKP